MARHLRDFSRDASNKKSFTKQEISGDFPILDNSLSIYQKPLKENSKTAKNLSGLFCKGYKIT